MAVSKSRIKPKMTRLACAVAVIAFASVAQAFAQAESALDVNDRLTRMAIVDIKQKVRGTLSAREQEILSGIRFSVTGGTAFGGVAARDATGRRTIVIYPGVAWLMNVLGQSMAVGVKGNVPCMQAHIMASIKATLRGMDPQTPASDRPNVWNIPAYAQIDPICEGAGELLSDGSMADSIGATTKVGLDIVILHEIAHQILGHVDQQYSDPPTAEELARSRKNEDEADRWALEKVVELGEPFELVTPYIIFMAASGLGNTTLEGERSSTHPNGARRAIVVLDDLEDRLLELDNVPDEAFESLRRTRRLLRQIGP